MSVPRGPVAASVARQRRSGGESCVELEHGADPNTGDSRPVDKERDRWNLKGYLLDWEHETMNVGEAHRQVQRFHKEVKQGAYLFYPFDDMSQFAHPGGHELALEALKLRHGLAVMDEYGVGSFRGLTREETLDRLEKIVTCPVPSG